MDNILIIGASSGIGAALAQALARPGRTLALVARRHEALAMVAEQVRALGGQAIPLACDVTDDQQVEFTWNQLRSLLPGLDTVVYCSGIMPDVGPDEFDSVKDRVIVETNLIGAMAWLNRAATLFLSLGRGTLCAVGSVAGDRGRRPGPAYGASKAALHTYMESLYNRLYVRGIRVVTIKPGPIDTPMARGKAKGALFPVDLAAKRIARAIERGEREVYVPAKWAWIMGVIRLIPPTVFRRLSI